jgi:hypothetical protein
LFFVATIAVSAHCEATILLFLSSSPMPAHSAEYFPRPPVRGELHELSEWLVQQGCYRDDADMIARNAYVAVYDHFATGCPGYIGKLMSVVWDGLSHDAFISRDGSIQQLYDEV